MSKARALIVDEDESTIDILRELISQKLESDVAHNLEEAMQKCADTEYDLIFAEIKFNRSNGTSVIEQLKKRLPNTLIVGMSYKPTLEQAILAIRQGAIDFLAKPFSVEELALVIEKYFSMTAHTISDFNLIDSLSEEKRTFVIPTDFDILNPFIDEIINMIKRFPGMDKKTLMVIRLSLYEMLVNAMEHGNLEIDYNLKKEILEKTLDYHKFLQERAQKSPYNERKVTFSYHFEKDMISFTITDEGKGFDVTKIPSPKEEQNLDSLSGRGIFITQVNMDEIIYNEKGNSVTLRKKLN